MTMSSSALNCTKVAVVVGEIDHETSILIIFHIILLIFASVGNVGMFLILYRNLRRRISHTYLLLLHMNIADLIVTFEYLPKKIVHMYTIYWYGGDILCKVGRFFDLFGVSLSSSVLICICIDRLLSVLRPFSTVHGAARSKVMISVAWISALSICAPQLAFFSEATHPCNKAIIQCVAKDYIGLLDTHIILYYTFLTCLYTYFIPLTVIIICYLLINYRLKSTMKYQNNDFLTVYNLGMLSDDRPCIRSSVHTSTKKGSSLVPKCNFRKPEQHNTRLSNLQKAKSKSVRMTLSIVTFFLICWTPYYIAVVIRFIDVDYMTGRLNKGIVLPALLYKTLYMFAMLNSSLNAYVYGYFIFNIKRELLGLKNYWFHSEQRPATIY